ncbi:LuxR family transcriptional regulator [Enterobacter cloacae]|nr:LuxR family transcriptional regulator [Enterobacter hormaechei subsp. hoffmannii ECNIH3]AIN29511.1 LuxR family transcriptional regulator [Enterobacter hormaechei subsp. hoffmannii ECR091]AIX60570.1 LuxR family transcriptional regulator [Enterobacter cloacae]CZV27707.1 Bacterial regulatory proteins%2C luxR family [Enterobacter hormaechei]SAC12427.1 Bacterial regulatory proteins%2C luxR family [Enterobacter hormaechei]
MATSIVLVTQDCFLVRGMRLFFPDIICLCSIDRNIFDTDANEYTVLIDSRTPLRLYDYLIRHPARTRKTICCVMLDMRPREEDLHSMKLFMNTSLTPPDMASLFNLVLDMKGWRLTTKWLLNLRLSRHEAIMLRLLKAGRPMEEIADKLNMSVKSLYRKRTALSERLGAGNFNEACLFIFKNKLLDAAGNDP